MRSLYRSLLWLHPPAFRREFAGEMLWIFDEAAAVEGSLALVTDGFVSLVRQWVLRCGAWKIAAGAMVAMLQYLVLSGLNSAAGGGNPQPLPQSIHSGDIAFSEGLLPVLVMLVAFVGILGVLRARAASRH